MCITKEKPFKGKPTEVRYVWKAVIPGSTRVYPLYQSKRPHPIGIWAKASLHYGPRIGGWHAYGNLRRAKRDEPSRVYIQCKMRKILFINRSGDVRAREMFISARELRRALRKYNGR